MALDKSVKDTIIGALLAFGLSGVGVVLFQKYLARPKPSVVVTSIGFRGPLKKAWIQVPEDLRKVSADSGWMPELRGFEYFSKLVEAEQDVAKQIDLLPKSIAAVESWVASNEGSQWLENKNIVNHPLFSDRRVGGTIDGMLTQGLLADPPVDDKALQHEAKNHPPRLKILINKKEDEYVVFSGRKRVTLRYGNLPPEYSQNMNLFINSLAMGNFPNLKYYSNEIIRDAQSEVLRLQTAQRQLRNLLLPQSALSARIVIYNNGDTPITMRPYFDLTIAHPSFSGKDFLLAADVPEDKTNPFSLNSNGFSISMPTREVRGEDAIGQPFLPETSASAYINVPAGQFREVTLVGLSPLAGDAEELKTTHATKLLTCQVTGLTSSGERLVSAPASFRQEVGDDDKKELLASLKEKSIAAR